MADICRLRRLIWCEYRRCPFKNELLRSLRHSHQSLPSGQRLSHHRGKNTALRAEKQAARCLGRQNIYMMSEDGSFLVQRSGVFASEEVVPKE